MSRKFFKCVGTVALACGMVLSGAAVANAVTTHPPEGGTWSYGRQQFGGTTEESYSTYFHPSKLHGAVAWWGNDKNRNWVYAQAGGTAQAAAVKAPGLFEIAKAGYSVNS